MKLNKKKIKRNILLLFFILLFLNYSKFINNYNSQKIKLHNNFINYADKEEITKSKNNYINYIQNYNNQGGNYNDR